MLHFCNRFKPDYVFSYQLLKYFSIFVLLYNQQSRFKNLEKLKNMKRKHIIFSYFLSGTLVFLLPVTINKRNGVYFLKPVFLVYFFLLFPLTYPFLPSVPYLIPVVILSVEAGRGKKEKMSEVDNC